MLFQRFFTILLLFISFYNCFSQLKEEHDYSFWKSLSKEFLENKISYLKSLGVQITKNSKPKNVILFIGDGMGTTITTVSRIFKNQNISAETGKPIFDQTPLSFEKFQTSGMVRTHSLDLHVGTSAAGALAMTTGQKSKSGLLNIKPISDLNTCKVKEEEKQYNSLVFEALKNKIKVGLVTTTRVSHATPAALYAFSKSRFHETDYLFETDEQRNNCDDIAKQIVDYPANQFSVIFGGGRSFLTPKDEKDPIYKNKTGTRLDGRNIIKEWEQLSENHKVFFTKDDLLNNNYSPKSKILGVFSPSHLEYFETKDELDKETQPTLEEMTESAIKLLSKDNDNGYFLMVEGGLIDVSAHENKGYVAFSETREFDKAIAKAHQLTKEITLKSNKYNVEDTLIIVTADHSHPLNFNGFPTRKKSVLGANMADFSKITAPSDNKTMPNLMFTSGRGFNTMFSKDPNTGAYIRNNLTDENFRDPNFLVPSCILSKYGSHGGEDVSSFSTGPLSYIFSGNYDNTQIAYNIKYALCINDQDELNVCDEISRTKMEYLSEQLETYKTILIYTLCICLFAIVLLMFISFDYFKSKNTTVNNMEI
uniref:alkaline phosphatase n=1 Tax=Strongyloides venezuelensis TaxID=75913 RepID=A0A0K0FMV5_STRVS